jgi:hypothetical protein
VVVARRAFGPVIAIDGAGRDVLVFAIERDGRFAPAPAPEGRGPSLAGQDFAYNRDIATNGRYVVLCWTALGGSIRASVGRL